MDGKHFLVRGARILQKLEQLEETTYAELRRDTDRFTPPTTKRQYATGPIHIVKMELVPYVNTTDLLVKAQANSAGSGKRYNPEVLFLDVVYEDADQPDNVTFTGADGNEYNIEPINLKTSACKVRCTCLDFYYRFANQNAGSDALYGPPPPPYRRKTENRPPANPGNTPGLCKHIIKTVDELVRSGLARR